jgi:hypothetical protein
MKIIIKYLKSSQESTFMDSSKLGMNLLKYPQGKYCDISYVIPKSEESKEVDILALKKYISKIIKIEKEFISIFSNSSDVSNRSKGLPDNISLFDAKDEIFNLNLSNFSVNKNYYYKVNSNTSLVNLTVEINIDNNRKNIVLNISGSCSIYMLKSNLAEDLNISRNSIELKNGKTNDTYNDGQYLLDLYNEFINNMEDINEVNSCSSEDENSFHNRINNPPKFRIILIQKLLKTKSKGINFFFNYMNEINKFQFQDIAPDYREASDGINLLFYCENSQCQIFNEMFIHKLGKLINLLIHNLFKFKIIN